MRTFLVIVMSVLSGAGLAACVDDSSSVARYTPDGARLVTVAMADIAYRPDTLTADSGELVTFLFRNDDDVVHEAVIGSEAQQLAHETERWPIWAVWMTWRAWTWVTPSCRQ